MAQFPKFRVVFDDGTSVDAQASSRDLVGLERDGVVLDEKAPVQGSYILAHATLSRLARLGRLPEGVVIPSTADELMDLADLESDDTDPEGKDEAPAPSIG